MALEYDIPQYLTKVKMSAKKRILVEGRDDKSHIYNLLGILNLNKTAKLDTAEVISGDCKETKKNNRAKIDKIHDLCKSNPQYYKNLYFLRDREFYKFNVNQEIEDFMDEHESDGNLSWTIGHSLENYFLEENLICDAFRYLSASEYKTDAENLFRHILEDSTREIAAITLAAKELKNSSYPSGIIKWNHFQIENGVFILSLDDALKDKTDSLSLSFKILYDKYKPVATSSNGLICSRICRGHTAIIMLQRIFAACLFEVISYHNHDLAVKTANNFSMQSEGAISNALSEEWLRQVKMGNNNYPVNLIRSIT